MSHLTDTQLDEFRRLLGASRKAALAALDHAAEGRPVEASGSTIGRLTRMDALQVEAMSQMSRYQLEIRIKQIDASLEALERGQYGICRHCDGPVAIERLEALPETPFCMPCQESFES